MLGDLTCLFVGNGDVSSNFRLPQATVGRGYFAPGCLGSAKPIISVGLISTAGWHGLDAVCSESAWHSRLC